MVYKYITLGPLPKTNNAIQCVEHASWHTGVTWSHDVVQSQVEHDVCWHFWIDWLPKC